MPEVAQNFIENFIEQEQLILHYGVLDYDFIDELDEAIGKGTSATRMFINEFYEGTLPDLLDEEALESIGLEIEETSREHLTEDDLKIIEFLSNEARRPGLKNMMNMTGVLANILGLTDELEVKSYCITPNIECTTYFWVYLNIYELILDMITKNLLYYYEKEDVRTGRIPDLEELVEDGEHLSAGGVNGEFNGLDVLDETDNSIFSKERARMMRNRLGHANVFYDDFRDQVVFTDGEKYSYEEFMEEYEIFLQFTMELLYRLNDQENDIRGTLLEAFENLQEEMDRKLIEFERSDRDWEKVILRLSDDA